jgi:hypothetical protein
MTQITSYLEDAGSSPRAKVSLSSEREGGQFPHLRRADFAPAALTSLRKIGINRRRCGGLVGGVDCCCRNSASATISAPWSDASTMCALSIMGGQPTNAQARKEGLGAFLASIGARPCDSGVTARLMRRGGDERRVTLFGQQSALRL